MPKFLIEREVSGASDLTAEQLAGIAKKSCEAIRDMDANIQWVESFVTTDKIYCVYVARDEEAVREHARRGGFPADRVSPVSSTIDPTTAE